MTVFGESGSGNIANQPDFLTLDWTWSFEVAHETFPLAGNWDSQRKRIGYGWQIWSWGDFKLTGTFLNFYEWTWDLKVTPLAIIPFLLDITWVFPEAALFDKTPWDMRISGVWDVHGLWINSAMTENLKMFTESIIDFAKDPNANKLFPT